MKENIKSLYSASFQQTSQETRFVIFKNQVLKILTSLREAKKPFFISKGGHHKDVNENSAFCSYFTHLTPLTLAEGLHLSASSPHS